MANLRNRVPFRNFLRKWVCFQTICTEGLLFAWKPLLALAVKHDPPVAMAIQADPAIGTGDTSLRGH